MFFYCFSSSRKLDWRTKCREILDVIWNSPDSQPFREPVDTIEHPDYLQIVDTPMDLRTIKEDLIGGNYENAADFIKDMRIVFRNSRLYNTNRQSRVSYLIFFTKMSSIFFFVFILSIRLHSFLFVFIHFRTKSNSSFIFT